MRRPQNKDWQFYMGTKPDYRMPDPRIQVSAQTGWVKSTVRSYPDHTTNAFPEPDNYTHCIWSLQPVFIDSVNYQCWYKNRSRRGWMSLYYVEDLIQFESQIPQDILALWTNPTPKPRRTRITRIALTAAQHWGRQSGETLEERLYNQGTFDSLIYKGADVKFVNAIVGEPRTFNVSIEQEDFTEDY